MDFIIRKANEAKLDKMGESFLPHNELEGGN